MADQERLQVALSSLILNELGLAGKFSGVDLVLEAHLGLGRALWDDRPNGCDGIALVLAFKTLNLNKAVLERCQRLRL